METLTNIFVGIFAVGFTGAIIYLGYWIYTNHPWIFLIPIVLIVFYFIGKAVREGA